jgi:hypothetical protein
MVYNGSIITVDREQRVARKPRKRGRGRESESHVHDGCLLLQITW